MKRYVIDGYSPRGRRVEAYINERGFLMVHYIHSGHYTRFNDEDYSDSLVSDIRFYLTQAGFRRG